VNNAPDSLKTQKNYTMLGQVSDDYGLSKLQIVYYEKDKPQTAKRGILNVKDLYDQFVFAFPSQLPVAQGVSYDYYLRFSTMTLCTISRARVLLFFSDRIATDSENKMRC
jgi:hypothetical protein